MERFSHDLSGKTDLETDKVLDIGISLVKQLKKLHDLGYTHNDIKPSNIMYDYTGNIHLIDFGCAMDFLDAKGNHFEQGLV